MSSFSIILLAGSLLLASGSMAQWQRGRLSSALGLLMAAAFLLRLTMASLDPFLHDWDERFHALVARNLMADPLRPLLRPLGALPYQYQAWCCNHVWLHKQPLFLWQMALSMKLFGINLLALRLPSALLGSLLLYPIYRLGRLIYDDANTGYLAAVLATFAYFNLEQTAGFIGMDHDDVAFMAYVGASVWAYYEYRVSARPGRWLVLIGVLAGAAVLCKWLTGLVVYAAWALDVLGSARRRSQTAEYGRAVASGLVAVAVALPWQLYTAWRYPLESAFERAFNARHFTEALEGHGNNWDYYFTLLPVHYGLIGWLMGAGLLLALLTADRRRPLGPLLVVVVVVYLFFSLAQTKMYAYVYVVSPLLFVLAARPLALATTWLTAPARQPRALAQAGLLALLAAVVLADARPWGIFTVHFEEGFYGLHQTPLNRAARTANASLYEHMGRDVPPGYIVVNALDGDEIAAMFHSGREVYSWPPSEPQVQLLLAHGYRLAAFADHHGQSLPAYIRAVPGLKIIWGVPQ